MDSASQEMNILILGETGVGKSTWINGFINFLTFESLEDAEKGNLCTLIPSEFTVCDEEFNEISVKTGRDKNEIEHPGHSATQEPKVYAFNIGKTTLRLIDTPGIDDTRGIDQDTKTFENILDTLSNIEELHAICIMLKPNNARLNVMFQYCIKQLLTHFHRDAVKNVIFCFTNSRGTFYRPGDTMPALKNVLNGAKDVEIPVSRNTVYCYDNEAYRYLAALKNENPVRFPEAERQNFVSSWNQSLAETTRMLTHIKGLPPHKVKETLNMNCARHLVLNLAQPLTEMARKIQTIKEVMRDKMAGLHGFLDLEDDRVQMEKLSGRLAYFLKCNAISAYNDGAEHYMVHLILWERERVGKSGGSKTVLENLEKSRERFVEGMRILEMAMGKGDQDAGGKLPGLGEVENVAKELRKLKHAGKGLVDALDCLENPNRYVYRETFVVHSGNNNWNKGGTTTNSIINVFL